MRLKLRELKAKYNQTRTEARSSGQDISELPKITNDYLYQQTGCSPAMLTALMNGTRVSIRCESADAITAFWRQYGFQTDDIWIFDEVQLPASRARD